MKSNICERRTSFDSDIYICSNRFNNILDSYILLKDCKRHHRENIDNFKTDILFFDSKIIREQRLESNDEYFKE